MTKRVIGGLGLLLIATDLALLAAALLTPSTSAPPEPVEFGPDDSILTGFATAIEPPVGAPAFDPEPTASPAATVSEGPPARLRAPRVGIDAPLITLGVDADRVMEDPDRPDVVAWYDFSSRPVQPVDPSVRRAPRGPGGPQLNLVSGTKY